MNTSNFTRFRTLFAILIIVLAAAAAYPGSGPGSLDLTFNGTGFKFDGFGGGDDWGRDAVVQPDGKIVVAGYSYNVSVEHSDVAVARYNPDGTYDNTFGTNGRVVTAVTAAADQALSVALQTDGKIVIAGFTTGPAGRDFLVVRYKANGAIDTSFGNGGKVVTPIVVGFTTSQDQAYDIAIQPDGKIVVAGTAGLYSAIVRYNSNGSLDGTFGGGVLAITPANGMQIFALAIQADGRIITGGVSEEAFALLRYNTDGTPDATFDGDGAVITHIFDRAVIYSLAIQPDGKIVAGGTSITGNVNSGNYDFALARYNTDGSLDTGFDGDGKFTTGLLGQEELKSVAIQADGKIVAAGATNPEGDQPTFAVLRCNANGSLDNTFGGAGKISTILTGDDFYGFDQAYSVVLQPDGKIVAAGISRYGGDNFAAVRYNSDGSLDAGFDGDGKLATDVGNGLYRGADVLVQPDGKIITSVNGLGQFNLARYNPDSTLDPSFGVGGKASYSFPSSSLSASPTRLMLQPDGKILVAGDIGYQNGMRIAVARFNTDGSFDSTFDGDGVAITAVFGGGPCSTYSAALGPDGKITVIGYAYNFPEMLFYLAIVRYNTDGSLDTSFDGDGILTTRDYLPTTIAVQPDGKMLLGGSADASFSLVRLNVNGSPDTSFDGDGIVTTPMSTGASGISKILLMPDGRILAGGDANDASSANFALARYNSDGSLDTTFDGDGKVITVVSPVSDQITDIAIQPDGRIVAGGFTVPTDLTRDLALVRYNPDGSLDNSYGAGGKAIIDLGYNELFSAMDLDATGKAIVTGTSYNFFIARITAEQAPLVDLGGRVTNTFGQGISGLSMVLSDPAGNTRYALTNGFGYYVFPFVASNDQYTVSISSKRFTFLPESQTVSLTGTTFDVDFTGSPNENTRSQVTTAIPVTPVKPVAAVKKGAVKVSVKGLRK
jgi:uncharacterized delta-60 repeat protein